MTPLDVNGDVGVSDKNGDYMSSISRFLISLSIKL